MKSWSNYLKNGLIVLSYLILFFYFYVVAFIATESVGVKSFGLGFGGSLLLLLCTLIVTPLLTASGMGLLYWRLRALSDSKRTRDAVRMLVALSALLALLLWLPAIVLPNGLWVKYWYTAGLGSHSETGRAYAFLPITAVPLIGLLFTTYSGHVLLMQREPKSFVWLVANHAPLLSVFALLFFVHEYDWIPRPFPND